MRELTESDIESLAIGAAILGTGGGGNPYLAKLRCLRQLQSGRRVNLISLDELHSEAQVVPVGGIGAPAITIEKLEEGNEGLRALRALEAAVGRKADALIAAEIGGGNSLAPIIIAAEAGLPVVDGDGMGRAFPEMQMTTFSIYGHHSTPAAIADDKGNVVVVQHAISELWYEKLARNAVITMGGTALGAEAPMSGSYVKSAAVPATVSQAIAIGDLVRKANREHVSPVPLLCAQQQGHHFMDAKIVDLQRSVEAGFSVGRISFEGIDAHAHERAEIQFQNEYLTLSRQGAIVISVPDLIVLLDINTGQAITTDTLRYGQRVSLVGMPCHQLLRTARALEVVGPRAFGLEGIEFQPISVRLANK
jgi:uncharacterized protein